MIMKKTIKLSKTKVGKFIIAFAGILFAVAVVAVLVKFSINIWNYILNW